MMGGVASGDAEGNRTRRSTIATGEAVEYGWDHRNRLTDVVFKDGQDVVVKRVRYTYDVNDMR
ncbi:MAG: hypothetical protein K8S55_14525, partial [Phycisphaerae bacterium]|nr:hypothetical protein [Phycisphaerae bacterium]